MSFSLLAELFGVDPDELTRWSVTAILIIEVARAWRVTLFVWRCIKFLGNRCKSGWRWTTLKIFQSGQAEQNRLDAYQRNQFSSTEPTPTVDPNRVLDLDS